MVLERVSGEHGMRILRLESTRLAHSDLTFASIYEQKRFKNIIMRAITMLIDL